MVTEELIIKCIAGEAEQHELLMVDKWRKDKAENEQLYQQVLKIWDHSSELEKQYLIDVDAAWLKVQNTNDKPSYKIIRFNRVWLAAASVVLLIGLGVLFFKNSNPSIDMVKIVTKSKQQLTLMMVLKLQF